MSLLESLQWPNFQELLCASEAGLLLFWNDFLNEVLDKCDDMAEQVSDLNLFCQPDLVTKSG